jgi:glycosyltransferase involved in cell wall biosynthesis
MARMGTNHIPPDTDVAELERPAVHPRTPRARPHLVRFSVVVPLYNKAAYVRGALQSVLDQTLPDLEVVVVDDGSTDGGAEIVEAFGDPRIRLVRQANAGVSVARNTAIEHARGEWVVFLDADDWQHPRFLASLQAVQHTFPESDFVATRYVAFADNGGAAPDCWHLPSGRPDMELIDDLAARWMRGPTFFTGSVAVRRSLLERMQPCFRPGESYGEDLELWFRLSEQTPIALASVPLAGYRTDVSASLTRRHRSRELPPWVERMRERVNAPGFDRDRRRNALALIAQFRLSMAREALAQGQRRRALALLSRAHHAIGSRRWWFTALLMLAPRLRAAADAVPPDARPSGEAQIPRMLQLS